MMSLMLRYGVVFWIGLVACVDSNATQCADGRVCPGGTICDVEHSLCIVEEQRHTCDGASDGTNCQFGSQIGVCDLGVCLVGSCGNGDLGPNEVCDDGNTESGDGCRGDCKKIEMCGDGELDEDEDCDDANENAADGCDTCVATEWQATAIVGGLLDPTTTPLVPLGIAVDAYDQLYIGNSVSGQRVYRLAANQLLPVAGSGPQGFSGDGGPAPFARLWQPIATADGFGNLFIADRYRVRRVDAISGTITTIAGTGTQGYTGDGGPAVAAQLSTINGIAVDRLGNVYVADSANHCIRRIDVAGTISTFAGTGVAGFSGDDGAATAAQLTQPNAVAFDADGNLYISDRGNDRVRRVSVTGIITTVAGDGTNGSAGDDGPATAAQLDFPRALAVANGVLYIADSSGHRVRRVDSAGMITTVAGTGVAGFSGDNGAATSAMLNSPNGLAIDSKGSIYIADAGNNRIRKITAGVITTVAGSGDFFTVGIDGAATSARLTQAFGLTTNPTGELFVADASGYRVWKTSTNGTISVVAGDGTAGSTGDGSAAASAQLNFPRGTALDAAGNLYIAERFGHRIRRVDAGTGVITTIAGTGTPGFSGDAGPAVDAQLFYPEEVEVDAAGNVYIADSGNARIRRVAVDGTITTVAGSDCASPPCPIGDGGPATSAQISAFGMVVDAAGRIWIADAGNHRIRRVAVDGTITTVAGDGSEGFSGDGMLATDAQLASPRGLALDANGNLYIADAGNDRVRRVAAATGTISTVAGRSASGFAGDGGAAVDAVLDLPARVAIDAAGNVFIGEESGRVRRIAAGTGTLTTVVGGIDPLGMGEVATARLAEPRTVVTTPTMTLFAGGTTGTLQALRTSTVEVVAGRYPQSVATSDLARFRDATFGDIGGVAFDAAANKLYVTETSANRLDVITMVDPEDENTWTIAALANPAGTAGFSGVDNAPLASATFRRPSGLYFDAATNTLLVADTGNHVVRAIDLDAQAIKTIAGSPQTTGLFGDGGPATSAWMFNPGAVTRCPNGDSFVADTGNHRVRRIAAGTGVITTVIGTGAPASGSSGGPARSLTINAPSGLACDLGGNLYVSSTTTVRLLVASGGIVDGEGAALTIFGEARDTFPASASRCLAGLETAGDNVVRVVDACAGMLVELRRIPAE
jgi:cysteine-rich repeat protein